MSNEKNFTVTPTLNGGKVEWKMCRVENGQPYDCGNKDGDYPNVTLDMNKGEYKFKITITDDKTGKNIQFADSNPIVIKKGEPPEPSKKQMELPSSGGGTVLKFKNKNSLPDKNNPADVVISYGLNFTDSNKVVVTSIDPDIKNGGTNIIEPPPGGGSDDPSFADYLPAFGLGLLVGVMLTLLVRHLRR